MRLMTALAVLATPAAAAIDPDGCYRRDYDAAHMAAHPAQVVSMLAIDFDGATGLATLRLMPRGGDAALGGAMVCEAWKATTICRADGDGGVMQVDVEADGTLRLQTSQFWTGQALGPDGAIDLAEGGAATTYLLRPDPDCEGF